jgi:hypothetical protein
MYMILPPPDKNGYGPWNEYRIDTPAFKLTSLEKPDMSPYLVHMTGRAAILGILGYESAGQGKINAKVPQQRKAQWYDSPVVCFTESPLFAIDAFRYIKFQRWQQDMRYGLGFSKEKLAHRGCRPVLYADSDLVTKLRGLKDLCANVDVTPLQESTQTLLNAILPLTNSLMEYEVKQGFIWEREWRHPDPDGFVFDYKDIEIICCPDEEREAILEMFGESASGIRFVSSWSQYDDVRAFLSSRSAGWETRIELGRANHEELSKLRDQYKQERNKLHAHRAYIDRLQSEVVSLEAANTLLDARIEELSAILTDPVEDALDCCVCGCVFDEENSAILWNDDEGDYICSGCYSDFKRKCAEDS